MASRSPVHIYSSSQQSTSQETSKTGLVASVGSARSYGTVKDSPNHSFLGSGLTKNFAFHTVEEGDTLQGLALKYNVTVHQIQRLNNLWNSECLHIRPTIKIPVVHSNDSSRSQSPSPTMSKKTDYKQRHSIEHIPSGLVDSGQQNTQTVSSCNGNPMEDDDRVKSKNSSRRRDECNGGGAVKSIADILSSADEQLKVAREFAEKLAQRSAERALPEGAYNRTVDMKSQSRQDFRHSPSPLDSQSIESRARSQSRRQKVEQSSEKDSATREEIVDQIFEL